MTVLKHPVVVIAGPTASGKSGLALDLAEALNGVVINADSMQIYQDTPIISAVPSAADKARVPHPQRLAGAEAAGGGGRHRFVSGQSD